MTCTEVKSSKYQTRKSPAFHASDCKGTRKKGKDGDYISKADKKGVYKWTKISEKISDKVGTLKKKGKHYDTMDNGVRPYRVIVDGSNVSIYNGTRSEDDTYNYDKLIRSVKVKKVYLGGKKKDLGNSILLHLSGNKYMYIGHEIYEFQMLDSVDTYFSIMGNSDVPYPVLLGTEYAYFMLDHCYVPRALFSQSMTKKDWEDAYQRYYGYTNPMTSEKQTLDEIRTLHKKGLTLESKCKKMKGFHIVIKRK
jgi:hypothetical protein